MINYNAPKIFYDVQAINFSKVRNFGRDYRFWSHYWRKRVWYYILVFLTVGTYNQHSICVCWGWWHLYPRDASISVLMRLKFRSLLNKIQLCGPRFDLSWIIRKMGGTKLVWPGLRLGLVVMESKWPQLMYQISICM